MFKNLLYIKNSTIHVLMKYIYNYSDTNLTKICGKVTNTMKNLTSNTDNLNLHLYNKVFRTFPNPINIMQTFSLFKNE